MVCKLERMRLRSGAEISATWSFPLVPNSVAGIGLTLAVEESRSTLFMLISKLALRLLMDTCNLELVAIDPHFLEFGVISQESLISIRAVGMLYSISCMAAVKARSLALGEMLY
jgi:hypothetical protein